MLLRLLALKIDSSGTMTETARKQRQGHAMALRNSALGVLSCLDLTEEQSKQSADLELLEKDTAARRIQAMRGHVIMEVVSYWIVVEGIAHARGV